MTAPEPRGTVPSDPALPAAAFSAAASPGPAFPGSASPGAVVAGGATLPLDPAHPRPQLQRAGWTGLDGDWLFAVDDEDRGRAERWFEPAAADAFDRTIRVPFPPESAASGIGDPGIHPVVWYRRELIARPAAGRRLLLHFGAVDHEAEVWVDGAFVGGHRGGYTAFELDITDALADAERHVVVVRAHDDPDDPEQPRGKQDWQLEPHVVWYHRSTGIWRSVWLEELAAQHVETLDWEVDVAGCAVRAVVRLARRPAPGTTVTVALSGAGEDGAGGQALAEVTASVTRQRAVVVLELPLLRNAQTRETTLWSPENPVLVDARIVVAEGGAEVDRAAGYLGLREIGVDRGRLLLNGRPYPVRAVLEQGYWEQSLYTPPDPDALRREVELAKELGFNTVRLHQKVEDPRLLHWADRLGLMVWAEMGSAYQFTPRAAELQIAEWGEAVAQQRSHPSVAVWVPLNESWGIQDVATQPAQREFSRAIAAYTRALDPSRPVISNDGWEHVDSDILGVHDYDGPHELRERYASADAVAGLLASMGPAGRRLAADPVQLERARSGVVPVMITEFGGVSFAGGDGDWGYTTADSPDAFAERLRALFDALRASPVLAGFCYTQLTDTRQETNGLAYPDRRPKLPVEQLRAIVTGEAAG